MADTTATLASKLRPFWLRDVGASTGTQASGGGGVMIAHALNGPYHTGTLDPAQAPWALTATALTTHASDPNAHHAQVHLLADTSALGADHTIAGATAGWVLRATGATAARMAQLAHSDLSGVTANQHHTQVHDVVSTNHTVTGAKWSVVGATGANALGLLTPSSNPGTNEALLKTDGSGYLSLVRAILSDRLRTPIIDTASGQLTLAPAGDLTLDPGGNDVLPANNYQVNLGAIYRKYLTIWAAELWVETLVAQETIATIGGRILIGPTTSLTRDLATGDTQIYVKHNQMSSGDRVYMESSGKIEFMAITSAYTTISITPPEYRYNVTRNLDGTGENPWYAGDALFNTGQIGNGFIDLYSLSGIPRLGQSGQRAGPSIVGNVRIGTAYNNFRERWAIGNLNGLYDYGNDEYGFAAGDPLNAWLGADATNGFRIMDGTTVRARLDAVGNFNIYNSAAAPVITLDNVGGSYFAGVMTIGVSGGIYQGSGSFAAPATGLKIWRDSAIGRIAGYSGGTVQWYAATDGRLYAGGGNVQIGADGVRLTSGSYGWNIGGQREITWPGAGSIGAGALDAYGSQSGFIFTTWGGSGEGAYRFVSRQYSGAYIGEVNMAGGRLLATSTISATSFDSSLGVFTSPVAMSFLTSYPGGSYQAVNVGVINIWASSTVSGRVGIINSVANANGYGFLDFKYDGARIGYLMWLPDEFRMHGDGRRVRISGYAVGIHGSAPEGMDFYVAGESNFTGSARTDKALGMKPIANPGASTVWGWLFLDSADGNKLKYIKPSGATYTIAG